MTERVRSLIRGEIPGLVKVRHELHRHPELSNQEKWTAGFVAEQLGRIGIAVKTGFGGGHGVVGYLPATGSAGGGNGGNSAGGGKSAGGGERRAVALRADMDALPIEEATDQPYASMHPGVMHACGHDGHTTILLGAARVLAKATHRPNPVTFIFQPAEEDGGGAEKMCAAGVLRGESGGGAGGGIGAPVGRIYGLHGWPSVEVGSVSTRPGPLMAATDDFIVDVRGRGGHAAYPHLCRDPIVAGATIVSALQTLASRAVAPYEAMVCTVGQFMAGTANNIIPDVARLVGTIRTLTPALRATARERFHEIVAGAAASHGCKAEIQYLEGYPVVSNDADETERFLAVARGVLGTERVLRVEYPTMGGEDFAYYGQHVPSCFFFLGLRPSGAARFPALHQPDFDFNDDAIAVGVELMCGLALKE
ncbi:MAG: M20 family metallopeptidase [Phycisphaerales bacterium]